MGYLKSVGTSIIYIGALLAAITFIPGIPPDAKFAEYSIVSPKELTGDLAVNERLNNAEKLFKGKLKGAEAFASFNGELYTGIHGGYVMKVTKDKLVPIVKFGEECEGIWQESKCGRPLGLKFDKKGTLYVSDAYYGIFKVDVKTGKYEKLVNNQDPIEGKVPMLFNSIDVASNGDIYWSDSSTEFSLYDGVYTFLSNPSGRLIRYNAATKKNEVLVYDLGFANGVALSEDEQFVIVLETLTSRITKYNIKGPKAGKRETFIEGLPGFPDNVHSDGQNGFLVTIISYADSEQPQFTQSVIPHPYIRRMLARLLTLLEAPFKCLQSYYPNYYAERVVHFIGGFESMLFLSPKIVTVLRIDNKGKIIDAAYSTDNNISHIGSAFVHNEHLWLGSPTVEYIARVPLKQAFPQLLIEEKKVHNTEPEKKPEKKAETKQEKKPEKRSIPVEPKQQKPSSTKPSAKSSNGQKSSQSNGKSSSKN